MRGKSKGSSNSSSRALKRLEAFNKSPGLVAGGDPGDNARPRGNESPSQARDRPRSVESETLYREESHESRQKQRSSSRSRVRARHSREFKGPRRSRRSRSRSNDRDRSHQRPRGRDSRSVSRRDEPPAWAKDLLEQQKQNATDLRRLESDLEAKSDARSQADSIKAKAAEHDFRFEGNIKKQQQDQSVGCRAH